MANVLLEIPDALLARVETKLEELNKHARPGKTALTKEERAEAEVLSAALGFGVGKVWIDSILQLPVHKLSRRALIVRLIDKGLEHIDIQAPEPVPLAPGAEKILERVKAHQKKRGSSFA